MQFTARDGVALRWRSDGDPKNPAMVFSNSLGTDLQVWDKVVAAFTGRFHVVRYDKRGHGLSDVGPVPYAIGDHVGDLAAVMDAAGVRAAIVVGLSVGGLIALGLAGIAPERVRALILSDTAPKIGNTDMWNTRIAAIDRDGIEGLAEPILERWFSAAFRAEKSVELAIWRNMLVRTTKDGYLGTCTAIRDADHTAFARKVAVPTLCVVGTEDGATPPALVKAAAETIPGAEYAEIEGAGHLPGVEAPAVFISLVNAFLARHGLG